MNTLQNKAINSIRWTTLQTIFVSLSAPVVQLIKAHFLLPEEFAYISIIMIAIGFFSTLENFGISQAIIQKNYVNSKEYSSLFFFNLGFSFICGLLLITFSPLISNIFSYRDLDYYLSLTSLIIFISGPSLLFRAVLEKNLNFNIIALTDILRTVINIIVLTFLLIFDYGILAVLHGHIVSTAVSAIIIITIVSKKGLIKIQAYFSFKDVSKFLRFGVFVSGKAVFTFLTGKADELIIGYFLPSEILGYYYFGKNIIIKLRDLVIATFGKVLFPVFSQIKDDKTKLSLYYNKTSKLISMIAIPAFLGIAITAQLFVPVIFGEQWNESVLVFQVYSVIFIFILIGAKTSNSLLYAVNKPNYVFAVELFNVFYLITLIIFTSKGLNFVLVIYSSYQIIKVLILQYLSTRQLNQSFPDLWFSFARIVLASILMVVFVVITQNILNVYSQLIRLTSSIVIGVVSYIGLLYLLEKDDLIMMLSAMASGRTYRPKSINSGVLINEDKA